MHLFLLELDLSYHMDAPIRFLKRVSLTNGTPQVEQLTATNA
jgi:hypothetical protein